MIRLTLALAVWAGCVTAAPAALAPRKESLLFGKEAQHRHDAQAPRAALAVVEARSPASDYVVTEETEVLVNGKPCRYSEVPANATILRMELGPDSRTVFKVHFRATTATSTPPSGR